MPIPEPPHEAELNFFYLHHNEAQEFAKLAATDETKLSSFYVRHCLLSAIFAAEALVNRVLGEFYEPKAGLDLLERLPLPDKWYLAPLLCAGPGEAPTSFDRGGLPFQHFVELVKIRNWLVHPKPGHYIGARREPWTITIMETGEEVPWVETVVGPSWPQTRLPWNPFEWEPKHAQQILEVIDGMVTRLKEYLPERITDTWLQEIELRTKQDGSSLRITTRSLWGGYTPDESDTSGRGDDD